MDTENAAIGLGIPVGKYISYVPQDSFTTICTKKRVISTFYDALQSGGKWYMNNFPTHIVKHSYSYKILHIEALQLLKLCKQKSCK